MILDLKHNPVYKKTKTYSYLYPMVADFLPHKSKEYLVNLFLGDVEFPKLNNHLFLLYRFSGEREFTYFEDEFENHSIFLKSYDPDKYHVMKVIKIKKDMKYNYATFRKSKYSQLTDDLKNQIVEYWKLKETHPIVGVLYKKEFVYKAMEEKINTRISRSQEASSVLDIEKEYYNSSLKVYDSLSDYHNRPSGELSE